MLRVFEENARVVTAGTPLLEIGDPADLEVVVEVLSRDGAAIPPGTRVELEQWGGGEPLTGPRPARRARRFHQSLRARASRNSGSMSSPTCSPRRSSGAMWATTSASKPASSSGKPTDALKVPAGALFRSGDQWAAFVVADGRAQLRPVKAGRSSGTETQVLEGLKEGEEVILYPGSRVRDGQRVKPATLLKPGTSLI